MKVTGISEGKRNKDRVNVYLDGEFAFACYLETALREGVRPDAELSADVVEAIRREDGRRYALDVALKYVAAKPRTQKEVEDKLRQRGADEGGIACAVKQLLEYGYLNDAEYAETYARELRQKYGGRVVEEKLARRGIGREAAKSLSSGEETRGTIRAQYKKLWERYKNDEGPKRRQKTVRGLMARGFSWDEIKNVMGGYENED